MSASSTPERRAQWELDDRLQLDMIGFLQAPAGWNGRRHAHPFWELLYFPAANAELAFRRRKFPVADETLYLLPPHEPHRLLPKDDAPAECFYIGFSFRLSDSAVPDGLPHLGDARLEGTLRAECRRIVKGLKRRKKEARGEVNGEGVHAAAWKLLPLLLSGLLRVPEGEAENEGRAARLVEKATAHLDAHLGRNVSVAELARAFYLSPDYFGKLFRAATGQTVKEYHLHRRMERAAQMLRRGECNISQIAQALGFESVHYFSRRFKQHFGVAPTGFR